MQKEEKYYSTLQKRMTITFSAVIIVPLLIIALVTTYDHKKSAVQKVEETAIRLIEHRKDIINLFLQKQENLLATLTGMYSLDYLGQQEHLEHLFLSVNKTNEIVDLQIIDCIGEQYAYVGPYRSSIKDKNYLGQPWFEEILISGRHISDVFTGYRDVPHFVVAVTDPLKTYVLRATVNSEIFNGFLHSAQIGPNGDAFIINRNLKFQTPSLLGVKNLTQEEEKFLEYHEGTAVQIVESYIYATIWINDGRWLLMIKSRIADSLGVFYHKRMANLFIVLLTAAITLMFAALISRNLTLRIEWADRQRREINNQIVQVEKMAMIGRLAAGIAHEINNPLQMITSQAGWAEELLSEEDSSQVKNLGEFQESIRKIKYHVKRAANVTHRLLGFSRKVTAEKENVNVNRLLEETISFVENDAKLSNIHIKKKFAEDMPTTMSDGPQLQQAFLNLINNALDAITADGQLDIRTTVGTDNIYIEFADTGTGIKPEIMDKIFDPFFTTKEPGKGTGLGMSICYDIMRKLGGKIDIRNRENKGAVFTLTLPIINPGK